jgi:hypothetical protein
VQRSNVYANRFKMCSLRLLKFLPWIVTAITLAGGFAIIERNPISIGGDEGIEFSMALLKAYRPHELPKLWNDQPWLYSWTFGSIFRVLGFIPAFPRGFSLLCTCLFCIRMHAFMPKLRTPLHHTAGILLFLISPTIVVLSVSAMTELPATLLGMIGASYLFVHSDRFGKLIMFLGGLLLGLAIQIKLTAGIVFGAATIAHFFGQIKGLRGSGSTLSPLEGLRFYGIWASGVLIAFIGVFYCLPDASFSMLWSSHAEAGKHMPPELIDLFTFHPTVLLPSTVFLFGSSVVVLLLSREPGPWLLPVCYGLCVIIIHCFHRPFYGYYWVHFAVAFAPIVGWQIVEILNLVTRILVTNQGVASSIWKKSISLVFVLIPLVLFYAKDAKTMISNVQNLGNAPRTSDNKVISLLRTAAQKDGWGFSYSFESSILAQSGILIVPELVVLSNNRFWGGFIHHEEVVQIVDRYQPNILLLPSSFASKVALWDPFLQKNYRPIIKDESYIVYSKPDFKLEEPVLQKN